MSFAENLKKRRTAANLSQDELAAKVGINRTSLSYFERGTRQPSIGTAQAIAAALGCELNELLR